MSPSPGTGELHSDPLLVDPGAGDFSLAVGSPCIDAGNPDPQFTDPDGTRNDMGALFLCQNASAVDLTSWGRVKTLFR